MDQNRIIPMKVQLCVLVTSHDVDLQSKAEVVIKQLPHPLNAFKIERIKIYKPIKFNHSKYKHDMTSILAKLHKPQHQIR